MGDPHQPERMFQVFHFRNLKGNPALIGTRGASRKAFRQEHVADRPRNGMSTIPRVYMSELRISKVEFPTSKTMRMNRDVWPPRHLFFELLHRIHHWQIPLTLFRCRKDCPRLGCSLSSIDVANLPKKRGKVRPSRVPRGRRHPYSASPVQSAFAAGDCFLFSSSAGTLSGAAPELVDHGAFSFQNLAFHLAEWSR